MKYITQIVLFLLLSNFLIGQSYTSYPEAIEARDAFSRLRVSNPTTLFDAQFTYDLQPLLYAQIISGTGATITHDTTNRNGLITFASTPTGGQAYFQSYEWFRYQPSKSQLIFLTFNMNGGVANVRKFAGYSDGNNGIEFSLNGTTPTLNVFSETAEGDETVTQSNWNLDKLDGTGASKITIDFTKVQILVIDFQALYVGRVRVGFDIDGKIIYVHEFNHANSDTQPYFQTANLPIRVGMTCTGTVSTTMRMICSAVVSEGGTDKTAGYGFATEGTVAAADGVDTHILSIQPKTTFKNLVNRSKIELTSVDVIVTGNSPVIWKLCVGQALTGTSTSDINTNYSAVQSITGTLSGSPAIVLAQGYVAATNQVKGTLSKEVVTRIPITLTPGGSVRDLGRLTLLVQGVGGASNTRAVFNWIELR